MLLGYIYIFSVSLCIVGATNVIVRSAKRVFDTFTPQEKLIIRDTPINNISHFSFFDFLPLIIISLIPVINSLFGVFVLFENNAIVDKVYEQVMPMYDKILHTDLQQDEDEEEG